jgi:hypothetical protein
MTYLEVHNRKVFESKLEENQMTAEDRKAMAAILSRHS